VPTLADERRQVQTLLDDRSPADAFTSYYALHHDPKRTQIYIHSDPNSHIDGFLVRAQTGLDLFRPVVVMRAASDEVAVDLLHQGLIPSRPYYLVAPLSLNQAINRTLTIGDAEILCVYRLDPNLFSPLVNVLVVANSAPDGSPRYEISQGDTVMAAAGVNWRSPHFAEVYVYTKAEARGRGWGKAVVSAVCVQLLKTGLHPLYVVHEQNTASIQLADSLGFKDTGAREYAGQVMLQA
jgi:GNAT superfamily N-acetyltransferase